MPKRQHSELAAGAFVVAGLAGLLGVVLWLGAADVFRTHGQVVTFYVPQTAGSVGIVAGAELTCGDGRIGRVVDVHGDPGEGKCFYRAQMERSDLTVKQDARAVVISPPIGQAKIVFLDLGVKGPTADGQHPILLTGGLDQAMRHIDKLITNVDAITETLREDFDPKKAGSLLAEIHAVVGDIRTTATGFTKITNNFEAETEVKDPNTVLGRVRRSAADINLATANLARQTDAKAKDTFMAKLDRAAGQIQTATDPNSKGSLVAAATGVLDGLDGVVKSGAPKVDQALASVASAAKKIDEYANKDLKDVFDSFHKITANVGVVCEQAKQFVVVNRDNLDQMVENLTQVSADLKAAAKDVRRNPWKLLREPTEKDAHSANIDSAIRAFSSGARELEEALAKLHALQQISGDDPSFKDTMDKAKKNIQRTYDKFSEVEAELWKELKK
jgi:ABC-type transporter Mla subunit MlaD